MVLKNEELRVVIGVGEYNNNPEWIKTQESELNLLRKEQWDRSVHSKYSFSNFSRACMGTLRFRRRC